MSSVDLVASVIFGLAFGVGLAYFFDGPQRPAICFVKDAASPFPIHPDDLACLTDRLNLSGRDRINFDADTICIYFPSHWNFADIELGALKKGAPQFFHHRFISACLLGHDRLACKGNLARLCMTRPSASYFVPESWTEETWSKIKQTDGLSEDQLLIAKTNLQRQTATAIFKVRDLPEMPALKEAQVVVIQRLLTDPLCIDRLKVTLRVYALVFVSSSQRRVWRFTNGFVYYSSQAHKDTSLDLASQVASGYNDREVYDTRPLTLDDLWRYIPALDAVRYTESIDKCLQQTIGALIADQHVIEDVPKGSFQLFGCDIFLKNQDHSNSNSNRTVLGPASALAILLEVNKAPDLTYKSQRDGQVKRSLMYHMWTLLSQPSLLNLKLSSNDDIDQSNDMWVTLL